MDDKEEQIKSGFSADEEVFDDEKDNDDDEGSNDCKL